MDVPSLALHLPSWLGNFSQLITATSCATALGLLIRWQLGKRSLEINADRVEIEGRKVAHAEEADIRGHWAREVQDLRDALDSQSTRHNDALTAMEERHSRVLRSVEERQERCERDREALADRLRKAEDKLRGVLKQISNQSADQLMILDAVGGPVSEKALAAARRIVELHQQQIEEEPPRDEGAAL